PDSPLRRTPRTRRDRRRWPTGRALVPSLSGSRAVASLPWIPDPDLPLLPVSTYGQVRLVHSRPTNISLRTVENVTIWPGAANPWPPREVQLLGVHVTPDA